MYYYTKFLLLKTGRKTQQTKIAENWRN